MTQTETGEIQKRPAGPLGIMKGYLSDESIKKRFEDVLGKRSGAFINSIINVVGSSKQLLEVARQNPGSVCRAAMRAATVNLAIDPALGHAAIVPYGQEAVFQIMYRGVIQLCIRSGQYQTIHCSEIYRDELKSHNPITGVVTFNDPDTFKLRYSDKRTDGDVVGHYVYFKLITGFEKSDYMTHAEVMAHARRYSKAYQYDVSAGKKASPWSTDPIPMGNKTVLLRCLKRYGVMSIEMQEMITADRDTFDEASTDASAFIAADLGSDPVDANFENGKSLPPAAEDKKRTRGKGKKTTTTESPTTEIPKFKYLCRNAGCGLTFNDPAMTGPNNSVAKCPGCGTLQICLNPEANGDQNEAGDYR